MSKVTEKNQAKVIQAKLKELGFNAKLGHAYEVIAALSGEKSRNVQCSKKNRPSLLEITSSDGERDYHVKLKVKAESRTFFQITANSAKEAYVQALKVLEDDLGGVSSPSDWDCIDIDTDTIRVSQIAEVDGGEWLEESDVIGIREEDFSESYDPSLFDFLVNRTTAFKIGVTMLIKNTTLRSGERIEISDEEALKELESHCVEAFKEYYEEVVQIEMPKVGASKLIRYNFPTFSKALNHIAEETLGKIRK